MTRENEYQSAEVFCGCGRESELYQGGGAALRLPDGCDSADPASGGNAWLPPV